jgi:arsenate reductase/regulatory protein spx
MASLKDLTVKELLNPGSTVFKKMGLKIEALDDKQAATLINENPRIMRRPLLSNGRDLVIGFDVEEYSTLAGV